MQNARAQQADGGGLRAAWLLGAIYFLYYLVVGPFQLVLADRCAAAGMGASAGAWAIGFLYAALGVARLIAGPVTEKLGARRTLAFTGVLLLASLLVTTKLALVSMLMLGTCLMGLASALLWSAGGAMALAVSQANRRGAAAGRLYVFTGMGLLLGALTVDFLVPSTGRFSSAGFARLQGLWLVAAVAVTLTALLLPVTGARAGRLVHPLTVLRRLWHGGGGRVFGVLAGAAISYGVFYGLVTTVIGEVPTVANHLGKVSLPLYAIMAFSSLVVGPLSDRIGRRKVLIQGLLAGAVGFAMLALIAWRPTVPAWLAWGLVGGGGFGLGWCFSSVQTAAMAWIGDAVPHEERSTAIGLIFVGRDLGITLAAGASVVLVNLGDRLTGAGQAFALSVFALIVLALTAAAPRSAARRTDMD